MPQEFATGTRTFIAGAAIARYARVKLSSGVLAAAGADDDDLGTLLTASTGSGEYRAVRLVNTNGTAQMIAASSISVGARVYAAAAGKVNDVANGRFIGLAMEAAAADGDVLEVLPCMSAAAVGTLVVEHHTASDTLTKDESGSVHTNLGAGAAITFTLPQDAVAGTWFRFNCMTAAELRVDPGAGGAIYINGAKQTDDKYVSFDDEGEQLTLTCDGNGDWIAGPSNGTFTVES